MRAARRQQRLRGLHVEGSRPCRSSSCRRARLPDLGSDSGCGGDHRGFLRFFEQGITNDAARVIAARIERAPVDIVELVTHLLAHPLLGAGGHIADALDESSESRRVFGQTFGTEQENGEHTNHQQLFEGQTEHAHQITLRELPARFGRLSQKGGIVTFSEIDARYIAEFAEETRIQLTARSLAHEHGISVIPPATGAHYATISAATSAANIVEVGTAFGVSGLWLLRGAPEATLTSIDDGYDRQEQAKPLFAEAGFAANQIRLITGRASDVLPRLNENSYDVVVVDGDPAHVAAYVEHALRLVRVGGAVLVPHVLWRGEVSDPTKRGAIPTAFRKMLTQVRDSADLAASMSPLGDGLLTISKLA